MVNSDFNFLVAFMAGLLSFVSPCVLPLIPGYVSYISGASIDELKLTSTKSVAMRNSIFFVLGFSIVFVLLGASATFIGGLLNNYYRFFSKAAGLLIVLFGLYLLGLFKFAWLNKDSRFHLKGLRASPTSAAILGLAFGFGWSPCIGPFLATILALAANQQTVWQGIWLLVGYSAGLGLPFILSAVAIDSVMRLSRRFSRYLIWVERIAAVLLIALGLLMWSGDLTRLAYLLS